jgi:hypothetical protein
MHPVTELGEWVKRRDQKALEDRVLAGLAAVDSPTADGWSSLMSLYPRL